MALDRLQKVLASAGVASRRRCEEIIAEGRVTVDGRVVTEMGVKVDVETQKVLCDGEAVQPERHVYYLLNKPVGVVCTNSDPQGRTRAIDLIPDVPARAYTVGRLDVDTEGLVIVTNDGALTQRVSHPRNRVPKTYRAWVRGAMRPTTLKGLLAGVMLDGRRRRAVSARIVRRQLQKTLVELSLVDGCKREVRRMLERLNHPVERLARIAIGPIASEHLAPGQWRRLKQSEVEALRNSGAPAKKSRSRPPARGRKKAAGARTRRTKTVRRRND